MAMCGVTAAALGRPVERDDVESMLSVLSLGPGWSSAVGIDELAGFGEATWSDTSTVWSTADVLAVCYADFYNTGELKSDLRYTWSSTIASSLSAALYCAYGT